MIYVTGEQLDQMFADIKRDSLVKNFRTFFTAGFVSSFAMMPLVVQPAKFLICWCGISFIGTITTNVILLVRKIRRKKNGKSKIS